MGSPALQADSLPAELPAEHISLVVKHGISMQNGFDEWSHFSDLVDSFETEKNNIILSTDNLWG